MKKVMCKECGKHQLGIQNSWEDWHLVCFNCYYIKKAINRPFDEHLAQKIASKHLLTSEEKTVPIPIYANSMLLSVYKRVQEIVDYYYAYFEHKTKGEKTLETQKKGS